MNPNEKYIKRCIELAKNGLGTTYPNPLVGSVVVYNDTIIGEGWHKKAGESHAEVNAINSVKDKSLLSKSTLYVNLEPCNHFGKTPPCSNYIIEHKIKNVVIGSIDHNQKVSGTGIEMLKQNGVNVITGVLEQECKELNKRFFTYHIKKQPYIILKWAQTADGFIAPESKNEAKPYWLSNMYSRQLVHKWRSEEQAVLVGTNTVIEDNPKLNTRNWYGNNPIRIVIDKSGKISDNFNLKNQSIPTIVVTEQEISVNTPHLIYENTIFDELLAEKIAAILYKHEIQSVIIEGGAKTLQTFINANIWDEARVFKTKHLLYNGVKAPCFNFKNYKKVNLFDDELLISENV